MLHLRSLDPDQAEHFVDPDYYQQPSLYHVYVVFFLLEYNKAVIFSGNNPFICLIWFFTSHQQSFSYKGTSLPGLNQY